MNHAGPSLNPSNQVPKVEPGTSLSLGAEQSTNGTVAGGAAAGGWTNQGLATGLGMTMGGSGVMGAASKPPPPLEAVKTRKKGLSVGAAAVDHHGCEHTAAAAAAACACCGVSILLLQREQPDTAMPTEQAPPYVHVCGLFWQCRRTG